MFKLKPLCVHVGVACALLTQSLFLPQMLWAQDAASTSETQQALIPTDPALKKGKLANGLQYYILRHTQPARNVELRLVVRAGSNNEQESERGIAHFLEHMVFNGTKRYPGNQLIDALENMGVQFGADLNAYTSFNETVYVLPIPLTSPTQFGKSMEILEELAFNATFDAKEVANERGVIMEEWRASGLSAVARQQDHNIQVVAKGSRYANRIPMGQTRVIQNMSAEQLRQFYKRWYRPDLMSVVVVGDVNPREAEQLVQKHFGGYKNPNTPQNLPDNRLPNNQEPLVGIFNDAQLTQSTIMLAHKNTQDFKAVQTVAGYLDNLHTNLMSQMINQRLQALLDGANPPFLQAASEVDYVSGLVRTKQALHWYAIANPQQETQALEALHTEALRIAQHGFTQAELDRAVREQLSFLNNDSNNYQKATEYVRGITEDEPLPQLEWERATQRSVLPKIQLADINRIARQYIKDDNRVALVNSNNPQANVTEQTVQRILAQKPVLAAYSEKASRNTLLPSIPKGGKVTQTQVEPSINVTSWTLSNGVQVHFKPVPNNDGPIIFSAYAEGGFSRLSDEQFKKVKWGFDGLAEAGVNQLSKTELARVLAGKDVSMRLAANAHQHGLNGKFNVRDSETAFQMMYSLMSGVNENETAFKTHLNRSAAATQKLSENRDAVFEEAIQNHLQRKDVRYTGLIPTANSWDNTDYAKTYAAYRNLFGNANGMQFTFVGNGNMAQMKQLSEQYLGALPASKHKSSFQAAGAPLDYTPKTIEVAKGSEALSQVRLIFGGKATYSAADQLALDALIHALNIQLTERLREHDSGVYSPYVFGKLTHRPFEQFNLTIGFACDPANVDKLIKSTQDEINHVLNQGIRAQDLSKFQLAEGAQYAKRTNTNEFWVDAIEDTLQEQRPLASIREYPTELAQLTAEKVNAVARRFLQQKPVTAILKPEK